MANPATTARAAALADERIPGLPRPPASTSRATLSVPVYNPATDQTEQAPLVADDGALTSNQVVGAPKLVRYRSSLLYGVPAAALTLDRLTPATIVPGTLAYVHNPADLPMSAQAPPRNYVATVVAAGTAGSVLVPRYIGAATSDTVPIVWELVSSAASFEPVAASEVVAEAQGIVGLGLHAAIVWLANRLSGTGGGTTPIESILNFTAQGDDSLGAFIVTAS